MVTGHLKTFVIPICLTALLSGACVADSIDGKTVLRKMLESESKVVYTAHQVTILTRGQALTSEQIVYHGGRKGTRMEYTAPERLAGEIIVDDGKMVVHYVPREKIARMGPSRFAFSRDKSGRPREGFKYGKLDAELVGRDKIAGRQAYVIEITPSKHHHGLKRKLWVDTEKWVRLKTEDVGPDGKVVSTSYFTRIEFVSGIPDEKFRFQPPPGVKVQRGMEHPRHVPISEARKAVDFKLMEPQYLPPGFKPMGAAVIPFRGRKMVAIRYTDGVSSFSLFQAPGKLLDRNFLERLHHGPVRPGRELYSWQKGEISLTLAGPLPPDQIRRIAGSVR